MKNHRFIGTLLAVFVLCLGSLGAQAGSISEQMPDKSLVYIVIKDMQQASQAVRQLMDRLQLPPIELLQVAKQRLNLTKGVVDTGDLVIALVGREASSPFPVMFLRTDSYDDLLDQLHPEDHGEQISRVIVGRSTVFVAKKGEYAVFTLPMFLDGLKQIVKAEGSVEPDDETRAFTRQAQVYAVVTDAGVKLLSQQAIGGLQMVKQRMLQMGPQGETVVAGLAVYEELFKWAAREVRQVALTFQVENDGSISLMKRVEFLNSTEYSVQGSAANATKQLANLPKWPYVMAFAGEIGDAKAMEPWIELSMDMMRAMVGTQKMTDEQIQELTNATRKSLEGLRGMSFTMGVPQPGGSVYSRMAMVMEVEDAQAYVADYVQAMQQMQKIFAGNEDMPYRILSTETVQIADVQGMKVVMKIMPSAFGPADEQSRAMFGKLLGEDGEFEFFAAPIDAKRVALAYVSKESLLEVMREAQSDDQGLAKAEGIQTTAKLLSEKAQWVGFMSPEGMVQYVRRMIETIVPQEQQQMIPEIPPFPTSPPLGFSMQYDGKVMEVEMVIPAECLEALGSYIRTARQQAAPH